MQIKEETSVLAARIARLEAVPSSATVLAGERDSTTVAIGVGPAPISGTKLSHGHPHPWPRSSPWRTLGWTPTTTRERHE